MYLKVTITVTPHSRDEAANDFVTKYGAIRQTLEQHVAEQGLLGVPPAQVDVRWLLNLPRWE